jgi:hypothetical protein
MNIDTHKNTNSINLLRINVHSTLVYSMAHEVQPTGLATESSLAAAHAEIKENPINQWSNRNMLMKTPIRPMAILRYY